MSLLDHDHSHSNQPWIWRVSAVVTLVVGGLTGIVSVIALVATLNGRDDRLRREADAAAGALERGVEQAALKLESVDGFFRGSNSVSVREFDAFVDSLDFSQDAESVAVAMRVEGAALQEFARTFQEMHPGVPLAQVGDGGDRVPLDPGRPEYHVVMYHRAGPGETDLIGLDLSSQQTRLQAIAKAMRDDETVVSAFLQLVGQNPDPDGFLIVAPVHELDGRSIGVAVAEANVSTLIPTWVPDTVLANVEVVVTGAGNERDVDGSLITPVEKAIAEFPDRSWSVSVTPVTPHWWVIGLIVALVVLTVGMAVGAGLVTRALLGRRWLTEQLELSEALAQERQKRVEVLSDFELITTNSTDLIVRQAPDLRYRWVSPSIRAMLGYAPEDVVGRRPWAAIHRDDADVIEAARQELVDGADTSDAEHRARHMDGRWVWLHTVFRAIRDDEGTLIEIQTSSRDVTEQVDQRAELLRSRNQTEAASAEKAHFLSTVSHEIRTPLTAIAGMADLLSDSELDADQKEQIETIRMAASSVVRLVNDLLELSKAEVGRLRIETEPFDLAATVADVVRVYRSQATSKGIELAADVGELPAAVVGDAHRIRQILVNLVGNALKFTSEGCVTVRTENIGGDDPDWVTVRVSVADTGIGIPDERLEAIFQEFEQVDTSTARRFGGTGLGLGISRYLVHLMGGVIGVESEEGRGSRFWFEVPLPIAEDCAVPAKRCLVIGRPMVRPVTAAMLRSDGWLVEEMDTIPPVPERSVPVVFVGSVDELARDVDLARVVVVDSTPRRGNAERVRRLRGSAYIGAPATAEELLGLIGRVGAGDEFVTRHDVTSPVSSLRVLAADDAPSNRLLVERTLSRRGHRVVSVSGGLAALEAFERGGFDVVVLDGHMPDLTGVEVTRHIRANDVETGRHTPIVALTGRVSEEERAEALAAGADMWVAKPFDAGRLHEVVEQIGGRVAPTVVGPGLSQVLDLEVFHAQVSDLPEFAAELVDTVRGEWAELAASFDPISVEADLEGVRAAAHRLRGVLGMVGATRAAEVAGLLEHAASTGDTQSALAHAAQLLDAYRSAESALTDALEGLLHAPSAT